MDKLHGHLRVVGYKDENGELSINCYDFFEFDLCTEDRDCSMEEFAAGILDNVEEAIAEIISQKVGIGEIWELIGEVKESDTMFYIGENEHKTCTVADLNRAFNKETLSLIYGSIKRGTSLKAA